MRSLSFLGKSVWGAGSANNVLAITHGSHPHVDNNFGQINHTSLLPLSIHPQWAHFLLLLPHPPPPEGITRIWLTVFSTLLLLTAIRYIICLLLIDTKILQRRSKSQELPQLERTRHAQPIRLLSQLQPGRKDRRKVRR